MGILERLSRWATSAAPASRVNFNGNVTGGNVYTNANGVRPSPLRDQVIIRLRFYNGRTKGQRISQAMPKHVIWTKNYT